MTFKPEIVPRCLVRKEIGDHATISLPKSGFPVPATQFNPSPAFLWESAMRGRHDFAIWASAAFIIALGPMAVGSLVKHRLEAVERAEACAWTHDADPHWADGRPMDAEDCRYMGGSVAETNR